MIPRPLPLLLLSDVNFVRQLLPQLTAEEHESLLLEYAIPPTSRNQGKGKPSKKEKKVEILSKPEDPPPPRRLGQNKQSNVSFALQTILRN